MTFTDLVKALVIQMRLYALEHGSIASGAMMGESVAWANLKTLVNVNWMTRGDMDRDLYWLCGFLKQNPGCPADHGPYRADYPAWRPRQYREMGGDPYVWPRMPQ